MFGLPTISEVGTQLPKTSIYAKFGLKTSERDAFDADVSRIVIANSIDSRFAAAGTDIKSIYVLAVTLKRKNYDPRNIVLLSKLIDQNIIFALIFEHETQLAVYCTRLVVSEWKPTESIKLSLSGLNLDRIWEHLVAGIGHVGITDGRSVAEQIEFDDRRAQLQRQIELLERKARSERQPRRKTELFEELNRLKQEL